MQHGMNKTEYNYKKGLPTKHVYNLCTYCIPLQSSEQFFHQLL